MRSLAAARCRVNWGEAARLTSDELLFVMRLKLRKRRTWRVRIVSDVDEDFEETRDLYST